MYLKVVWRKTERVPKARAGESTTGGAPSRKGGSGDLPRENFDLWAPLSAFLCILDVSWARISVVLAEIFGRNNIYIYIYI